MKKWCLFVVVALMIVLMIPAAALAEETYVDWSDATSLPTSGTYRLTTDVDITINSYNGLNVGANSLTLDLNGHVVNFTASRGNAISLVSGGKLTILDSSFEKKGKITNAAGSSAAYALIYANGGSVTLEGGTLEGYGAQVLYVNTASGSANLKGGSIVNKSSSGGNAVYINGGTLDLSGTAIVNEARNGYALFVNAGAQVEINGGEISNVMQNGYALHINGEKSKVTLADGLIQNTVDGGYAVFNNTGSFAMTGGTVKQESTYSSSAAIYANNSAVLVEISGGRTESNAMGVYAAFTPVNVSGGEIDAETYALQTRNATVEPAEGKTVEIKAKSAILYLFSGSDNKIMGGDFDAPAIKRDYTSEDPSTTTISGGSFSVSPDGFVEEGRALAAFTAAGQQTPSRYVVGDDIIEKAKLAESGDEIEVISGNVALEIVTDGVKVVNSGSGKVNVNGQELTDDPLIVCVHEWSAPVWTWQEDNLSATAVFTCTKDASHTQEVTTKEIEKNEILKPTCTQPGKTEYIANVEFGNIRYEDKKVVEDIDMLPHDVQKVEAKEPTTQADGNIACLQCKVCGKYFTTQTCEEEIANIAIPKLPVIIKGAGSVWEKGSTTGLSITSDAAFVDFLSVAVDGTTLAEKDYTVEAGSTVVTLKPSYLEGLDAKEHTIAIVSKNGTATATFTILAEQQEEGGSGLPQTGDNSNMLLWVVLLVVIAAAAAGLTIYMNKKRRTRN